MKAAEKAAMPTNESDGIPHYLRDAFPSTEQRMQRELLAMQIEAAKAAEASRLANPKAEGSASRARKLDLVVIALLAADAGCLEGDLTEHVRELLISAQAKGYVPNIEIRQVKERLESAKRIIDAHKSGE
jgi:hypothetical protein